MEDTLEPLRPRHGGPALGGRSVLRLTRRLSLFAFAPLGGGHPRTMPAVGCEHTVTNRQDSRFAQPQAAPKGVEHMDV